MIQATNQDLGHPRVQIHQLLVLGMQLVETRVILGEGLGVYKEYWSLEVLVARR